MELCIFNLYILLQLCFVLDRSAGVNVTDLSVPVLADPRDSLVLGCTYDMGGEELHSVKWYKDEQEFFRYTPRQQPHTMSFPVAGVHLEHQQGMVCDTRQCSVRLMRLSTQHSGGIYKCEVSTEAPKFRVGFRTGKVIVAAVGRAEPQVQGVHDTYLAGDLVQANCRAAAADPAPALAWLLNGAPISTGPSRVSPPDQQGLVIAERDLRFLVEHKYFTQPGHLLQLVCIATPPPDVPAPPITSLPAIARLLETHQQQRNQPLEWHYGTAGILNFHHGLLFSLMLVTFC